MRVTNTPFNADESPAVEGRWVRCTTYARNLLAWCKNGAFVKTQRHKLAVIKTQIYVLSTLFLNLL